MKKGSFVLSLEPIQMLLWLSQYSHQLRCHHMKFALLKSRTDLGMGGAWQKKVITLYYL